MKPSRFLMECTPQLMSPSGSFARGSNSVITAPTHIHRRALEPPSLLRLSTCTAVVKKAATQVLGGHHDCRPRFVW